MEPIVFYQELISWINRPFDILFDGGKFGDRYLKETNIELELEIHLERLSNRKCDNYEKSLLRTMYHPKRYMFDFPMYRFANYKLRKEFRGLHDEICSYLYENYTGGGMREEEDLLIAVFS